MTFTQDNKGSGTFTQADRSAVVTLSQDSKATGGYLLSDTVFPFLLDYPLLWEGNGQVFNMDDKS